MASGGSPDCPDHVGQRTLRSEVASFDQRTAYISGIAVRDAGKTCSKRAELVIKGPAERTVVLAGAGEHDFSIVDFTPDGRQMLLEEQGEEVPPKWDERSVSVAVVDLAGGSISWVNAWDLFGWKQRYATVEAQGFTNGGKVIVRARPSVFASARVQPNCVSDWGLYETDLRSTPVRLPDSTKVSRFGRELSGPVQPCKSDPDIVDACFTVRGRASVWNGSPSLRIWRVGTKRILGDHEDWALPEDLAAHMDWGVEAWGDFEVCPFAHEKPGEMQMVCIESAKNVVYRDGK